METVQPFAMTKRWLWLATVLDMTISGGLACLLVWHLDWRCCTVVNVSLDAAGSILGYTVAFGVFLPIIFIVGGAIVEGVASKPPRAGCHD